MTKLSFLLFFLASTVASASTVCESSKNSCEYYLCREKANPCGPKGYFIGFGYRYCYASREKFADKMTENGKVWLVNVAQCLRDKTELAPIETACDRIKSTVVNSHSDCYLKTGFCDLPKSDRLKVIELVSREVTDPEVLKQGLDILSHCSKTRRGRH